MDRVSAIEQAVLYEGYILWPYRRSAPKNSHRWTFGAVFPRVWSERHPDDASELRSEVLIEGGPGTRVSAKVRFLQVVLRRLRDAAGHYVDELEIDGERHVAWEEARERELSFRARPLTELGRGLSLPLLIAAGSGEEALPGGTIVRSWERIEGAATLRAREVEPGVQRLALTVRNTTPWDGSVRQEGLHHALVSTHVVWYADGGAFASLTDPPQHLESHTRACDNAGTWPVLAGEQGDRSTVLSAPIILEDHPRVAPESRGDMFDGGEIDQLLVLNILGMTEVERREMAATDPRAREILARCEALGAEDLMSLHGAIRDFGPVVEP